MNGDNGIYILGISAAARSSIRREVFALRAVEKMLDSDFAIEAHGNPTSNSIDVWMRISAQSHKKQHRVLQDTPRAGEEIADWIRELHPLPVREIFDGGPY